MIYRTRFRVRAFDHSHTEDTNCTIILGRYSQRMSPTRQANNLPVQLHCLMSFDYDNDNDKEVWKQLTPCLRYDSNLNGAITFNKKARRNYDLSVLYRLEMSVKTFFFLFETKEEQQNCHDFAVVFFVCRLAGRLICCKCHLGQGVTK